MSERLIVTVQHLHTVPTWTTRTGYCAKQSRAFFAEQGLDWLAFVREGIDADVLLATGNALAEHLVAYARSVEVARHGQ